MNLQSHYHLKMARSDLKPDSPGAMLDALELAADAFVELSVKAGKLVVDTQKRRGYSLDKLLAQCNR
jgi:antitoxin component of MazEF toxin-antitoxin module